MTISFDKLSEDIDKALFILFEQPQQKSTLLSAVEISSNLQNNHGYYLHWKTIESLFEKGKEFVARKKKNKRWYYSILQSGINRLENKQSPVILVEPAKAVQAVLSLQDFLNSTKGGLSICDPYFDSVTIQHLDCCPKNNPIKLLTQNIKDPPQTRLLLQALRNSGLNIEIRIPNLKTLHDRYIIDDKSLLILGASLNGFGKKQCFIINVSGDFRLSMLSHFNQNWSTATIWN